MLETIYATPFAQKRHRAGPFLEERERYLKHCAEQGGTQRTQYQRAAQILWLAQRMQVGDRQGVDATRLSQLIQAEPAPGASLASRVDIYGRQWQVYPHPDATAMGVANLAAMATNSALNLGDFASAWKPVERYSPKWSADRAESYLTKWRTLPANAMESAHE
jgi:hypothetical protein